MARCTHPSTKSFRTDDGYDVVCNKCGWRWRSTTPHVSQENTEADKARYDSYMKSKEK